MWRCVSGSHRKANTHAQQSALLSRTHPLPGSLNTGRAHTSPFAFRRTMINRDNLQHNCCHRHVHKWELFKHTQTRAHRRLSATCKHALHTLYSFPVDMNCTHTHTQVGAHTDLHSTWASTGERWGYTHSCSRATCSTVSLLRLYSDLELMSVTHNPRQKSDNDSSETSFW